MLNARLLHDSKIIGRGGFGRGVSLLSRVLITGAPGARSEEDESTVVRADWPSRSRS